MVISSLILTPSIAVVEMEERPSENVIRAIRPGPRQRVISSTAMTIYSFETMYLVTAPSTLLVGRRWLRVSPRIVLVVAFLIIIDHKYTY
jgi:hypothetical protein